MSLLKTISAVCLLSAITAPAAVATPVSMTEVETALRDHGVTRAQGGILSGNPVISASMDSYGFTVVLRDCFDGLQACEVVTYKACRSDVATSRMDALEIANRYNSDLEIGEWGKALVEGTGDESFVCVRHRTDMTGTNKYGLKEVFLWRDSLGDFNEMMDEIAKERQLRSILGSGASQ